MAGDLPSARNSYVESRKQSYLLKEREGIIQVDTAIRRLDRQTKASEAKESIDDK